MALDQTSVQVYSDMLDDAVGRVRRHAENAGRTAEFEEALREKIVNDWAGDVELYVEPRGDD